MAESFDPYHRWLGIPPKQQPANLYRLLGIELFESEVEVIRDAAEQRMAHVRTYQLGPNSELSQKILNELAAAKACLLDAAGKAAYDASLRATLAGPAPGVTGSSPPARDLSDLLADAEKEAPALPEPAGLARRRRKWLPTGRKGIPTSRPMPRPSDRYSARWPRSLWALLGVPALAVVVVFVLLLWFSGNARDILRAMGLAFQETDMASQPPDPGSRSPQPTPEPPAPEPSAPPEPGLSLQPMAEPLPPEPSGPPNPSPSAAPPSAVAPFDAQKAREHQDAWAKHLGVPVETTNSIGMKLVLIPPGEFMMGNAETAETMDEAFRKDGFSKRAYATYVTAEYPQHRVRITRPFYLAVCELTVGQFGEFVSATNHRTDAEKDGVPANWRSARTRGADSHPVTLVSWNDSAAFTEWLSGKERQRYRLPTEAEWEYACRAGSVTRYFFGDDEARLGEYEWYRPNSGYERNRLSGIQSVGQKKPNPFGLCDMHGNAREWCADWFDSGYYASSPSNDPVGPSTGSSRVLRGGRVADPGLWARSSGRSASLPNRGAGLQGFRIARTCGENEPSSGQPGDEKPLAPPVPASTPMPAPVPVPTPAPPPAVAPDDEAKANQRKSAEQLGVPITLTNTIGMKFVLIPPGEFLMGSPDDDRHGLAPEKPQHRVTITKPFYLGVYEVTQLEFARMMRANPSNFKGDMKRPVEQVTWNHAVEFCRRLSAKERVRYRLPTESEWEYACRAGSTTRYCFGDSESQLGEFAWYGDNSGKATHPVGQKKPNAWGLYDVHGNVWEWCADWYGTNYYRASPATDPTGPTTGSGRVSRGGGFDPAAVHCRSAKRGDLFLVNGVYLALGFRVARAAE